MLHTCFCLGGVLVWFLTSLSSKTIQCLELANDLAMLHSHFAMFWVGAMWWAQKQSPSSVQDGTYIEVNFIICITGRLFDDLHALCVVLKTSISDSCVAIKMKFGQMSASTMHACLLSVILCDQLKTQISVLRLKTAMKLFPVPSNILTCSHLRCQ